MVKVPYAFGSWGTRGRGPLGVHVSGIVPWTFRRDTGDDGRTSNSDGRPPQNVRGATFISTPTRPPTPTPTTTTPTPTPPPTPTPQLPTPTLNNFLGARGRGERSPQRSRTTGRGIARAENRRGLGTRNRRRLSFQHGLNSGGPLRDFPLLGRAETLWPDIIRRYRRRPLSVILCVQSRKYGPNASAARPCARSRAPAVARGTDPQTPPLLRHRHVRNGPDEREGGGEVRPERERGGEERDRERREREERERRGGRGGEGEREGERERREGCRSAPFLASRHFSKSTKPFNWSRGFGRIPKRRLFFLFI